MVIQIAKDVSLSFTRRAMDDIVTYDMTDEQYQQFVDELSNPDGTLADALYGIFYAVREEIESY